MIFLEPVALEMEDVEPLPVGTAIWTAAEDDAREEGRDVGTELRTAAVEDEAAGVCKERGENATLVLRGEEESRSTADVLFRQAN